MRFDRPDLQKHSGGSYPHKLVYQNINFLLKILNPSESEITSGGHSVKWRGEALNKYNVHEWRGSFVSSDCVLSDLTSSGDLE